MSECKLTAENPPNNALKGRTFFIKGDDCIVPTAIYVSDRHGMMSPWNVILWFHGHHVKSMESNVFSADMAGGENKLRESVDAADQDVVLIVPFLGYKSGNINTGYGLGKMAKGANGVKGYLDQVLGLIGNEYSREGLDSTDIDKFVMGCHSGSDYLMRAATSLLGDDLKKTLKECWGFDCINSGGQTFATWAAGCLVLLLCGGR